MNESETTKQTENGIWTETATSGVKHLTLNRRPTDVVLESTLSWRPTPRLASDYLRDQAIEFEVSRDSAGNRRLNFPGGGEVYTQHAWLAGRALLKQSGISNNQLHSYRLMKNIYDRVRKGHEHVRRQFKTSRDLYVRPKGRYGRVGASVVPEVVGQTPDGVGRSWSIRKLTATGREAAQAEGVSSRNSKVAILYGLTRAAELFPLYGLSESQINKLVFASLFDQGDLPEVSDAIVADVLERITVCDEEHGDDDWDEFEQWFAGKTSNFVQTLARKSGFEKLPRDVVKSALLTIGWQSYSFVARCLAEFARAVPHGLNRPFNHDERQLFDAAYFPQAYYGGMPLVMLMQRGDLLELVVQRLWANPTDQHLIGVLHRLLSIYAELAPARRAADRNFKRLRNAMHCPAMQSGQDFDWSKLQQAVVAIVNERKAGCPDCHTAENWLVEVITVSDERAEVAVKCEPHEFAQTYELEIAKLIEAVDSLSIVEGKSE